MARKWRRELPLRRPTNPRQLRYVVAIALTYRRYGLPLADLVAEGNFGLVHAVSKFDPEQGKRVRNLRRLLDPGVHAQLP